MRHAATIRRASASVVNTCSFRYSSRIAPEKLSTMAFCVGLPGAMQRYSTDR